FSGDPSFQSAHLHSLLSRLASMGIKRITGDVVLVSHNAKIPPYGPNWLTADLKHDYGAPAAPVILDENRITFTVNPAIKESAQAIIELSREHSGIKINNEVTTDKKRPSCAIYFNIDNDNILTVKGCVRPNQSA